MKKRLKINGVLIFLGFLSIIFFPDFFFRTQGSGGDNIFTLVCGICLILLGQFFRASGRGYKSEHSQNGHVLTCGGPYALVRNPMYLGILLIGLGMVVILFKWWVAGIFMAIFILRYIFLIFTEEKKLSELFSREYPDYKMRVRRLLPSAKVLLGKNMAEYLPLKLNWLKKESGSMLATLLATLLLKAWADIRTGDLRIYYRELLVVFTVILLFVALAVYLIRRAGKNTCCS